MEQLSQLLTEVTSSVLQLVELVLEHRAEEAQQ